MEQKSYWIWHYGEYEIYHAMQVHLRREAQGYHVPAFWKIATPYASVKFRKELTSDGGYIICHANGDGYLAIDGARHPCGKAVTLSAGAHKVEICLTNYGGLPAAFVESDVCPSGEGWLCNHFAGEFLPVGWLPCFDTRDKNPEVFPFAYERVEHVAQESVAGGVLYDFGRELFGYLTLTGADARDEIGVYYGESREEALDPENCYLYEVVTGKESYRLRQRAFRYVYVRAPRALGIFADHEYLPLTARGGFACEEPLFDRIFDVAATTFHLNCREGFFDGIKRDRWIWAGDAYQSARINRYLFADKEIEQRTLIGLIGKRPIEQHINTILDYSLLWITMLDEHDMTYGDTLFLRRIYPMAEELLAFLETRLNPDGFLEGRDGDWTFIDWSRIDKCGAVCAEQMLLIAAYRAMARMATRLEGEGDELIQKAEQLAERVRAYYWDGELGAFIDSYASGKRSVTRHANIFAVMFGIANERERESILKNVLKNDAVTRITTPYFEGYELDVLASLGELSAVEEMLRSYWGGMLALGATTVWEEYQPEKSGIEHYAMYGGKFEKSLCHAWGAGPIYLFGRYYLGVYPTAPGYASFEVAPNRGGLARIAGCVPLPGGEVRVSLDERCLTVTATQAGGTLVFGGKRYPLVQNETLTLAL